MLTILSVLQLLATLTATLFAGAALYINVAEHPARMTLDTRTAVLQWAPSYHRATRLHAPLALASSLTGALAWLQGAGLAWLVAALLIGAVVPYTFVVVMPTNRQLLDPNRDPSSPQTRQLLARWTSLHAVRTGLSIVASIVYLLALRAETTP